ncbi:MAG: hypothetical protein CL610_22620 [Anaerolineaceae bacterium]|nr:hypothetical protein [Anaerolineaceae bacterium]
MDYGMISQIEKARLYANEPERVTFQALNVTFKGDNDTYTVTLDSSGWHCTCPGFQTHYICPHIMTLERVLKPMLKIPPLPYAPGQNVVSDVDKAARYATEKDRILINGFTVSIRGNNGDHSVSYDSGAWNCDSNSFRMRGVSSHTIAMERLLKGMLPEAQKV